MYVSCKSMELGITLLPLKFPCCLFSEDNRNNPTCGCCFASCFLTEPSLQLSTKYMKRSEVYSEVDSKISFSSPSKLLLLLCYVSLLGSSQAKNLGVFPHVFPPLQSLYPVSSDAIDSASCVFPWNLSPLFISVVISLIKAQVISPQA